MKTNQIMRITILLLLVATSQSCYKSGTLRVQNYSGVVLDDVRWGDQLISDKLLSNESSRPIVIAKKDVKLPSKNTISCKVHTNRGMIYVETDKMFQLNKGEDKVIQLNKYSFFGYLKSHYNDTELTSN